MWPLLGRVRSTNFALRFARIFVSRRPTMPSLRLSSSTHCVRLALALFAIAFLCTPVRATNAQSGSVIPLPAPTLVPALVPAFTPALVPAPTPAAKPFAALSNSVRTLRDSVVQMAKAQIGKRYRTGGQTPEKGFDCSGLVSYVMAALDLKLPRTARQQATQGLALTRDTSRLLPGDLLTFGKTKKSSVSHVGIYIGEGRYIHASSVAGKVIESAIDRPASPLIKMWRGARRMLSLDDSVAITAIVPPNKSGG